MSEPLIRSDLSAYDDGDEAHTVTFAFEGRFEMDEFMARLIDGGLLTPQAAN